MLDKEQSEDVVMTSTPGMLGQQASGGLYAGPTSAASHLINVGRVVTIPDCRLADPISYRPLIATISTKMGGPLRRRPHLRLVHFQKV